MKKCYKVKNLFGPYIYNIATDEERDIVESHIKTCNRCAEDLRTRQIILRKASSILPSESEVTIKDDRFTENVYRRLALEFLNRRSKQVFIQKYILQPSFAVTVIIIGIIFGLSRLNSPVLVRSIEVQVPMAVKNRIYEQKVYAQAKANDKQIKPKVENKQYVESSKITTVLVNKGALAYPDTAIEPEKSDVTTSVIQFDDSMERLTDANMINYSLGDRRRAIAEYQRIIDDYPNTNAAIEAQNLLKIIMESEMIMNEEYFGKGKSIDKGI